MRWFNIQPKRNALQQAALEKALATYNSDPKKYEHTMFCPYCGSPLIKSGTQRRFETLSEHVGNPNGTPTLKDEYICSAEGLFENQFLMPEDGPDPQVGCKFGILHAWNDDKYGEKGGSYSSNYRMKLFDLRKKSIVNKLVIDQYLHEDYENRFHNALNTFNCQAEASIYKTGLPDRIKLPAWITLNIIQLTLEFSYEADMFGIIKKTWVKLGFLKKDRYSRAEGFCLVGTWPWYTWIWLIRKFKRNRKRALKYNNIEWLKQCYEPAVNTAWVYRAFHWYITHRHYIEYKALNS